MTKVKPLPSCEKLNKLFKCNLKTGSIIRRISVGGIKRRSSVGSLNSHGYMTVSIDRQKYLVHRIIWKLAYGSDPVGEIDHIDCNKTNNRITNLRCATRGQNQANIGPQKNNKSGLKGVYYCKQGKIWRALIRKNKILYHLGHYKTSKEAAQAYAKAAKQEFGEFARWEAGK